MIPTQERIRTVCVLYRWFQRSTAWTALSLVAACSANSESADNEQTSSDSVQALSACYPVDSTLVTVSAGYLYTSPGYTTIVTSVPQGADVTLLARCPTSAQGAEWYEIAFGTTSGWLRSDRLKLAATGSDAGAGVDSSSPTSDGSVDPDAATVGPLETLTPIAVPRGQEELANPFRGAYLWYEQSAVSMEPPGWPMMDAYNRFFWTELEPSEGQYDFSAISQGLAYAKQHGGKFGFRVMPANSDASGAQVPAYLVALMPNGFYTSSGAYVPDWNSTAYMQRAAALITALGNAFANDPRLGWFEISPYGNWGEWHVYLLGGPTMTSANQVALVNDAVAAFPNKRLSANAQAWTDTTVASTLSQLPQVSWRQDCLGTSTFSTQWTAGGTLVADRWKTAPLLAEFCGSYSSTAYQQVVEAHLAMPAGNMPSYGSLSSSDQQSLQSVSEISGYRFVVDSVRVPSWATAGATVTVTTAWSNVNLTPAYNPWNVEFQLRDSSGSVVWQQTSQVDLEKVLPTTDQSSGVDTPQSVQDSFALPSTLAKGNYSLVLQVIDPDAYYPPLSLAITGRQNDGSYVLGSLQIH